MTWGVIAVIALLIIGALLMRATVDLEEERIARRELEQKLSQNEQVFQQLKSAIFRVSDSRVRAELEDAMTLKTCRTCNGGCHVDI